MTISIFFNLILYISRHWEVYKCLLFSTLRSDLACFLYRIQDCNGEKQSFVSDSFIKVIWKGFVVLLKISDFGGKKNNNKKTLKENQNFEKDNLN